MALLLYPVSEHLWPSVDHELNICDDDDKKDAHKSSYFAIILFNSHFRVVDIIYTSGRRRGALYATLLAYDQFLWRCFIFTVRNVLSLIIMCSIRSEKKQNGSEIKSNNVETTTTIPFQPVDDDFVKSVLPAGDVRAR